MSDSENAAIALKAISIWMKGAATSLQAHEVRAIADTLAAISARLAPALRMPAMDPRNVQQNLGGK